MPRPRPDIAIIEFASNDAALHRLESIVESATNVTAIIHRLRAASTDIRLYLMTMSPATSLHGLLRLRLAPFTTFIRVLWDLGVAAPGGEP